MTLACRVANDLEVKALIRIVTRYAAGYDVGVSAVTVERYDIVAQRALDVMGHQSLADNQLSARFQLGDRLALGIVNALDLHHLHLAGAAFFHIHLGDGVEDALA